MGGWPETNHFIGVALCMHLLEFLFILSWYIFNSVNKQTARITHTTAKNTAMVVDEMAQSAKIIMHAHDRLSAWAHNYCDMIITCACSCKHAQLPAPASYSKFSSLHKLHWHILEFTKFRNYGLKIIANVIDYYNCYMLLQ